MKIARRILMLALLAVIVAPVMGCGVGTTAADNRRVVDRIIDYDARMMVDDISVLMQTNRTLRTSRWVID